MESKGIFKYFIHYTGNYDRIIQFCPLYWKLYVNFEFLSTIVEKLLNSILLSTILDKIVQIDKLGYKPYNLGEIETARGAVRDKCRDI